MEVLLTHGYFLQDDPKEQAIMKPYVPLGILSVSAYLSQQGLPNEVFDTTFQSREDQLSYIREHRPKVIGIYTNLMTKVAVLSQISRFKNVEGYHPQVVLGGPDVRYNWENYLKHGADYLVVGEGEESFHELCRALLSDGSVGSVKGIARNTPQGPVMHEGRDKIKDINQLPLPARDKIDLKAYLDVWRKHHGRAMINVSTQRGCPYTCKWCSTAVYGQSYRRRDPLKVVDELELLKRDYGVQGVWFVDDVFTVSHKWLSSLHAEMTKRGLTIPFECITRAERMNDEVLQQLKDMGCFRIWIGAESGAQKIIDRMDRRVDIHLVRDMIRRTREFGMEAGTFIMVGYPDETLADIRQTIQYLKSASPDQFTITVSYPIKGTGLYEEIESDILVQPEWSTSTDRDIDFKRTYKRRFYDYAVKKIVNEVRYHQAGGFGITRIKYKLKSLGSEVAMQWYRWQ